VFQPIMLQLRLVRVVQSMKVVSTMAILLCLVGFSAASADETSGKNDLTPQKLEPGPLLMLREKLLKTILEEGQIGVGVKPYLDAFMLIEKSVHDGKDETVIKSELDRLSVAIAFQQKHTFGDVYTSTTDKIWAPYILSILRRVKYNWHPAKSTPSNVVVLRYSIYKDGGIYNIVIFKSSGDPTTDHEAVNAVKRASPVAPWPAIAEDNKVDVEQSFNYRAQRNAPGRSN
jgi:TonB family protein